MNKKITKPVHSVIEHDEYFYRHPEMYRTNLDDELSDADEFDPNDDNEKMYSTTFICYTFFS